MITLPNLYSLTHDELEAAIKQRCSEWGTVANVVVLKNDKWNGFALAGVEMSTPAETAEVLRRSGDHQLDTMVVITIQQA